MGERVTTIGKMTEQDIGRKVVFKGFNIGMHTHWQFTEGEVYEIQKDVDGDIGPMCFNDRLRIWESLPENYNEDFNFEWVDEEEKSV